MIKLVDARKGLHEKCLELFHNEKVAENIYMYLCDGIEECDSVEPELYCAPQPERKKGNWIKHPEQKNIYGGKCIECSECGEKYMVQYIEDEKYCRNCGADMRGEQE